MVQFIMMGLVQDLMITLVSLGKMAALDDV
jgi:hypothetical protein